MKVRILINRKSIEKWRNKQKKPNQQKQNKKKRKQNRRDVNVRERIVRALENSDSKFLARLKGLTLLRSDPKIKIVKDERKQKSAT